MGRDRSLSRCRSRSREGSSRSRRASSEGPVLARFFRPALHFFPTEPMRERSGVFVVEVFPTSAGGSSSDVVGTSRVFLGCSGVTGRACSTSSARSSSSKMPSSKFGGGRDFLRRRRRSRWMGGLGGRRARRAAIAAELPETVGRSARCAVDEYE